MNTFYVYRCEDGRMTMQEHEYIESGWVIEIDGAHIALHEIPEGGGEPQLINTFDTLTDAVNAALELS